jgi:hypothetical protein
MTYMLDRLREPGTHTGAALLTVIVLLANLAGIDLKNLADSLLGVLTAIGSVAAAAKTVLPDAPRPPVP